MNQRDRKEWLSDRQKARAERERKLAAFPALVEVLAEIIDICVETEELNVNNYSDDIVLGIENALNRVYSKALPVLAAAKGEA